MPTHFDELIFSLYDVVTFDQAEEALSQLEQYRHLTTPSRTLFVILCKGLGDRIPALSATQKDHLFGKAQALLDDWDTNWSICMADIDSFHKTIDFFEEVGIGAVGKQKVSEQFQFLEESLGGGGDISALKGRVEHLVQQDGDDILTANA